MGKESQKMGKKDALEMQPGQCGCCGLKVLFWSLDETIVECVKCGAVHEVERGEAVDFSSGETSEVAWFVVVLVESGNEELSSQN